MDNPIVRMLAAILRKQATAVRMLDGVLRLHNGVRFVVHGACRMHAGVCGRLCQVRLVQETFVDVRNPDLCKLDRNCRLRGFFLRMPTSFFRNGAKEEKKEEPGLARLMSCGIVLQAGTGRQAPFLSRFFSAFHAACRST